MTRGAAIPASLLLVVALLAACGGEAPEPRRDESLTIAGVWLAHRDERPFSEEFVRLRLERLAALGYDHVALAAEPAMTDVTRPLIELDPDENALRRAIRAAHAVGLQVMLFPRIESPSFFRGEDPLWRGDIAMSNLLDWESFHDRLEEVLVHYARLATEEKVALFSLGLEYRQSTRAFPERWRRIAAAVREVYAGPITYSANWYEEWREIAFWDALDLIGIGAYFPIATTRREELGSMRRGAREVLDGLAALARRERKELILTEIGFPGDDHAGLRPWEWTDRAGKSADHEHQADCYRALFLELAGRRSIRGLFVWRYEADPTRVGPLDYSPEGRPAETVIAGWLGKKR